MPSCNSHDHPWSVSSLRILTCPTSRGAACSAALQILISCRCKLAQWSVFATAAGCLFWFCPARRCRALVCLFVDACPLPAWLTLTAPHLLGRPALPLSPPLWPSPLCWLTRVGCAPVFVLSLPCLAVFDSAVPPWQACPATVTPGVVLCTG